jgi:hypothetical protein
MYQKEARDRNRVRNWRYWHTVTAKQVRPTHIHSNITRHRIAPERSDGNKQITVTFRKSNIMKQLIFLAVIVVKRQFSDYKNSSYAAF